MSITFWYAISIAALYTLFLVQVIYLIFFRHFYPQLRCVFSKYIGYALLTPRRNWGRVTRGEGLSIALYIILNGFSMGLGIHTYNDLLIRASTMASINMVPLFFGGRTSIIAEFLGFSLHSYYLAHIWIGCVVILQSSIHVILVIGRGEPWTLNDFQVSGIYVRIIKHKKRRLRILTLV